MIRTGQQPLNPADRAMLTVDRVLRSMGAAGFETQAIVETSGRIDAELLRATIARVAERHPVITARLDEFAAGGPCWRFRPGSACPLRETTLPSAESATVLSRAGLLLSEPSDPAAADPIRFHLLHGPGGSDVFLMQYNHALMDNSASVLLLREMDRLFQGQAAGAADADGRRRDLVWEYLRRCPRPRRRQAAIDTLRLWGRSVRGGVVSLSEGRRPPESRDSRGAEARRSPAQVRIATRCLEQEATRALQRRVLSINGFPSLSMALAGSVFRAIGQLTPRQGGGGRRFLVGIGIDLGLRGRAGPILQNLVSVVPVGAPVEELGDRDALVRTLSRQLRERLAGGADLGMLQAVAQNSRRPRPDFRWAIEHFLRHGFSLWYAYFGALDALGDHFCGAPVERAFFTGPAWAPLGVTLLVNQHRERLFFQASYTPESVPEPLAKDFLDAVVSDLIEL